MTQAQGSHTCTHCGRSGHSSTREEREKSCPAFNKKCDNCGSVGHFKLKCRRGKKVGAGSVTESPKEADKNSNSVGVISIMKLSTSEITFPR